MSTPQRKSFLRRILFGHCDALGVNLWSCPSFIFLIMGVVIAITILTTYVIVERHADPEIVIGTVTALTVFLLIITQVLVNAFERVVRARQLEAARTKEVLELKDQFVYLAVHDLSSAATAVKWGLKMIEHGSGKALSPAEHDVLGSIRTRNEQLIALVHQILLITRIERGPMALHPTKLNLSLFLEERLHHYWEDPKHGHASFTIEIDKHLPPYATDKELFEEVINTLLFNARAYASHKGAVMAFTAKKEGDTTLIITVENNGDGIAEELQKHIFEKFWSNAKTGKIERAGFGLYIAQTLAHMLGGNITFTSDKHITRFTLRLPLSLPTTA